jgi:hypothetical protein
MGLCRTYRWNLPTPCSIPMPPQRSMRPSTRSNSSATVEGTASVGAGRGHLGKRAC